MSHNNYRTTAIIVAVLFLTTDITAITGLLLYQPLLTDPSFVTSPNVQENPILWGALLEMVLACSVIGTGVMLYPILKRQNESLALGYVVLRALEATVILIGVICLLSVLSLRERFLLGGGDASTLQAIAGTLVAAQKWTFLIGPNLILPINAMVLGYLLFSSRLIPRWISALYLFDGPVLLVSSICVMFGLYGQKSAPAIVAAMPMLAFEVLFSFWLLFKGFDPERPANLGEESRH